MAETIVKGSLKEKINAPEISEINLKKKIMKICKYCQKTCDS